MAFNKIIVLITWIVSYIIIKQITINIQTSKFHGIFLFDYPLDQWMVQYAEWKTVLRLVKIKSRHLREPFLFSKDEILWGMIHQFFDGSSAYCSAFVSLRSYPHTLILEFDRTITCFDLFFMVSWMKIGCSTGHSYPRYFFTWVTLRKCLWCFLARWCFLLHPKHLLYILRVSPFEESCTFFHN